MTAPLPALIRQPTVAEPSVFTEQAAAVANAAVANAAVANAAVANAAEANAAEANAADVAFEAAQEAAQATQEAVQEAAQAAEEATQAAQEAAQTARDAAPPPPPPGMNVAPIPEAVFVPGMGYVIPMTRRQAEALADRSDKLTDSYRSTVARRKEVAKELETATVPEVITGLQERLKALDARLLTIEKEIAENSTLRSSMAARLAVRSDPGPPPPPRTASEKWGGPIVFFTLVPIGLVFARNLWRRGNRPPVVPISREAEARFNQLEQAIDTVAVEIERVAEGQRFVTKLLREGQSVPDFSARPVGAAVPRDGEAGR